MHTASTIANNWGSWSCLWRKLHAIQLDAILWYPKIALVAALRNLLKWLIPMPKPSWPYNTFCQTARINLAFTSPVVGIQWILAIVFCAFWNFSFMVPRRIFLLYLTQTPSSLASSTMLISVRPSGNNRCSESRDCLKFLPTAYAQDFIKSIIILIEVTNCIVSPKAWKLTYGLGVAHPQLSAYIFTVMSSKFMFT